LNKCRYRRTKEHVTAQEKRTVSEKIRSLLLLPGPKTVAEPEKELRFTRMAQAPLFHLIAAVAVAAAIGIIILSTQKWGMSPPPMQKWWWLIAPDLFIGWWFFRLGLRCSQHAYLILTPLGVEIFPFFNAHKNLQVLYWTQIAEAEVDSRKLIMHFSDQKNSGVVVSLRPILPKQRKLLKKAIEGRMEQTR
jgi:hypothetical protein